MFGTNPVQAIVGLSGFQSGLAGLRATEERVVRLELPDTIGSEHVAAMRADFERLADIAGRYPETLAELQNAVMRNDRPAIDQAVDKLGLRPPPATRFIVGEVLVVAGIIGVLLIAGAVMSSDSPPVQKVPVGPEGGVPGEDAGDAGAG